MNGGLIDHRGALEAIERILNRGGHADDVLRAVLAALHERGVAFGAVRFVENGELVDGPSVGDTAAGIDAPVAYEGRRIGSLTLAVDDLDFVARVATLISPYVLVGSDPGGERWAP